MSGGPVAVYNGKLYSTQDIVYLLAVLAPTRRNERMRKRLHRMLRNLEKEAICESRSTSAHRSCAR